MNDRPFIAPGNAIDDVLVAGHTIKHWLKRPHPGWDASIADGMLHFGEGAAFDLWVICRAIERLRLAWTGHALPDGTEANHEDPL